MSNIYEITQCPHCKKEVFASDGSVQVRGGEIEVVKARLAKGETIADIAQDYCDYCIAPKRAHTKDWDHEFQPQNGHGYC